MYLQTPEGHAASISQDSKFSQSLEDEKEDTDVQPDISSVFPFGTPKNVERITGPGYFTPQTLIQQVAYSLSDKLFSYSPETFSLDDAIKKWAEKGQKNGFGRETSITSMQTRTGAAAVLLGYVFSADRNLQRRSVPQSVVASTATLLEMRNALDQLALLYSVSSPFVAHVAAVDYSQLSFTMVTDYYSALSVAQDTGVGLVVSNTAHEAQHMALFATAMSSVLPTVHVYDGVKLGRETTKVVDVLDQAGIYKTYESVLEEQKNITKREEPANRVGKILKSLNTELGTSYQMFEYEGHDTPEAVLVVFGSVESSTALQVAKLLATSDQKIGVVSVRVYRPFSETHFLDTLPKTVKRVAVLGQVNDEIAVEDKTLQSPLYGDVLAALMMSDYYDIPPPVVDVKYPREKSWSPRDMAWILDQVARSSQVSASVPKEYSTSEASIFGNFDIIKSNDVSQFVFWDHDDSTSSTTPAIIAKLLASDNSTNISYIAENDNFAEAGLTVTRIRSSKKSVDASYDVVSADVVVVNDIKILSTFDVAAGLRPEGSLILKTSVKDEDLEAKLPASFKKGLAWKKANLHILNIPEEDKVLETVQAIIHQLSFLQVSGQSSSIESLSVKIANMNKEQTQQDVQKAATEVEKYLRQFAIPEAWSKIELEEVSPQRTTIDVNSFSTNEAKHEPEHSTVLKSASQAAIGLSFKEAYDVSTDIRPDLPIKNYIVRVQKNQRLTPTSYDRNIFHIEFDLAGTGMKYEIGEALGIHGHNDLDQVDEFIKWYGLNPTDIVEVPSRDDEDILEIRTIAQALVQNIDIFGRPPKRFYEALAEFATDEQERKNLFTLGSPEGRKEFARRAEVDTVTYADVLLEFKSAHPEFHEIVKMVSPLKRREYSIASSQVVNPNSVHLLVVVVNWRDSNGRDRFGQCTRYLSTLSVGAQVVVSVKPSVMKLPQASTAPLIMAGLGTGLAPFRAFVQYRAWQKEQGIPIGAVLLYMGARHQREEYLYGEEWEAWEAAGVITRIGKAFSRDQKEKIYIQDRMRQQMDDIVKAYMEEEGSFYLCGPTWPVPDVQQVLMEAIGHDAKNKGAKVDERRRIEELKDVGRYVLEVY